MRILQLTTENVKRISAVTITPQGGMVVIGGRNGQGKSSVLDSIAMAIGGAAVGCAKPLREGAARGKTVLDLGDLVVTRTYTAAGGSLVVSNKDGARFSSPQAVLDSLVGRLTFDPLAFTRMKPKEQAEALRKLVGIDFAGLDAKRKAAYDERATHNREAEALAARINAAPPFPGVPEEEVSVVALSAELTRIQTANGEIEGERIAVRAEEGRVRGLLVEAEAAGKEVERLRRLLRDAEDAHERKVRAYDMERPRLEARKVRLAQQSPESTQAVTEKIIAAETTNQKVRRNREVRGMQEDLANVRAAAGRCEEAISAVDEEKESQLRAAKFPVEGLSFDEEGVTFSGIPFAQASAAEQLRVSVAMGMAMNPKLKVILIRDGSLLDDESLRMIGEMAEASEAQVWVERVGTGKEVSVIIEDGRVAGEVSAGGAVGGSKAKM
jgi:hypothetical protein